MKEEPFAWEARETLRKLLIGKTVQLIVDFTNPKNGSLSLTHTHTHTHTFTQTHFHFNHVPPFLLIYAFYSLSHGKVAITSLFIWRMRMSLSNWPPKGSWLSSLPPPLPSMWLCDSFMSYFCFFKCNFLSYFLSLSSNRTPRPEMVELARLSQVAQEKGLGIFNVKVRVELWISM